MKRFDLFFGLRDLFVGLPLLRSDLMASRQRMILVDGLGHVGGAEPRIGKCCTQIDVAQELLNDLNIYAVIVQMRCEAASKHVNPDVLQSSPEPDFI